MGKKFHDFLSHSCELSYVKTIRCCMKNKGGQTLISFGVLFLWIDMYVIDVTEF